ncbi:DUF2516 family protein [Actinomyces sp. 2119]|uniref:DUF2516 family protein n=2 Tax=Actinomycetaceae TaxID=2049 RepID=A0ABM6Z6C3_9ACTO|nr:DUF2516 family protein [Actinomyces lilanjuaniae]RJF42024.1 DUF2516 family protein [Actinomyces sp. 2119]
MTAIYLDQAVLWAWRLSQLVAVLLGVWALIDALMRDSSHFVAAGKRTKGFWVGLTAAGTVLAYFTAPTSLLGLLGVVASAVYLADVRPALRLYTPVRVRSSIRIPGRAQQKRPGGQRGGGRGPRDWRPGR